MCDLNVLFHRKDAKTLKIKLLYQRFSDLMGKVRLEINGLPGVNVNNYQNIIDN